jgi:outer membrane biogenesis lipoprotein LolB
MRTRYLCAVLAVGVGLLGGCTSTTTTTTTQSTTDQTTKRVHTQEELRKSGESQTGPALEKTDPAITTSRR